MKELKLLPCPFCGGRAELVPSQTEDEPTASIRCVNCGDSNRMAVSYWREKIPDEIVIQRWNTRAALGPAEPTLPAGRLNLDKLDDAVLALLSLNISFHDSEKAELPADTEVNYEALMRLHKKGMLADEPSIVSGRGVYLTREGACRAHELFRKLFCD